MGTHPPPSLKSMAYGDFQAPTDPDPPTRKEKNVSPPGQMHVRHCMIYPYIDTLIE